MVPFVQLVSKSLQWPLHDAFIGIFASRLAAFCIDRWCVHALPLPCPGNALRRLGAWTTQVQLAIDAFINDPVRPGPAVLANPLDQRAIRLEQLKGVRTGVGHCRGLLWQTSTLTSPLEMPVQDEDRKRKGSMPTY